MDALEHLRSSLNNTEQSSADFERRLARSGDSLARTVASLEKAFQISDGCTADDDQIRESLEEFVRMGRLATPRDAKRVCFGLPKPIFEERTSLFEDARLFPKVLDRDTGVDQWLEKPRTFRGCFLGLTASYFKFDGTSPRASQVARHNWSALRDYLYARIQRVHTGGREPDWVGVLGRHAYVLSSSPFGDLPRYALTGDGVLVRKVFDGLLVSGDSWFRRDLLLAQVKHAAALDDAKFIELIERLIGLVEASPLIRDEALALMLNRYIRCRDPVEHKVLRDVAVEWWGNPWLPSKALEWGRVHEATRDTIARWLHKEFIEAFFSKLAANSEGDRRRARFWLRYVGTFTDMKFGLGPRTLSSQDPDFKVLIEKMKGLYGWIDTPAASGDAFIMTLGGIVVVEFSDHSNALYAYDAKRKLPFVVEELIPLRTSVDARNSLKHSPPASLLKLRHQDNVLGYGKWEDRFADELKRYSIVPPDGGRQPQRVPAHVAVPQASAGGPTALPENFYAFAKANKLPVEDLRARGGNLWVLAENNSRSINATLRSMGFSYKPGKGWWKGR